MKFLLILALCLPLRAQSLDWLTASQVTMVSASAVDAATSWGGDETNPVLGRGRFGRRQLATKSAIMAGLIIAERPLARRSVILRKSFTIANFVTAGILAGTAYQNSQIK